MAAVSYLYRRGARYHYQRRLYLRNLVNRPITVALGTADPIEARRLVGRLSVRWDMMAMMASEQRTRGFMTATEAVAVFRRGLDEELGLVAAGRRDNDAAGHQRTSRVMEAAYRIAAQLDEEADELPVSLLSANTDGFSESDRRAVVLMLGALSPQRAAAEASDALKSVGAPVNAATIRDGRIRIILAKAEAQARSQLIPSSELLPVPRTRGWATCACRSNFMGLR